MAPKAFMKDLRRLSKTNFQKGGSKRSSHDDSFAGTNGNGHPLNGTSRLMGDNSSSNSSHTTPPPSLPALSTTHLPYLTKSESSNAHSSPQRPVPISSSRSCTGSSQSLLQPSRSTIPISPFAPRVTSISENSWVNHKILLIYGQVGDARPPIDGTVTINLLNDSFPSTIWPVQGSQFKALLHLVPGPNKIRLDFFSHQIPNATAHQSTINVNYLPMIECPPLHLIILLGKDSLKKSDSQPEQSLRNHDELDIPIRKYRMAAYLWQAFTQEQMYRNNFARRSFRFEEEWQTGTLSSRDTISYRMRNEAKIHVIRCDKTAAELRALSLEHSSDLPEGESKLFKVAKEAILGYFNPKLNQKTYVTALILDSYPGSEIVTRHAAVGHDVNLAIFGSHALHTYPSCIEEVISAFADSTEIDSNFPSSQHQERTAMWEVASANIGAHLREIGRMFGCQQQDSGIMGQDYLQFSRSFMSWIPYRKKNKEDGQRLCLAQDESNWHRLDALRFRLHPCFRHLSDPVPCFNGSLQVWPVDGGKIVLTSQAGIAFIEVYTKGDAVCKAYLDYMSGELGNINNGLSKQVTLVDDDIRTRIPNSPKTTKNIKLVIYSGSLYCHAIDDLFQLKSKASTIKLPNGQTGYRGNQLGSAVLPGTAAEDLILDFAMIQTKLLISIKVFHSPLSVSGIEFHYEDATIQFFGNRSTQFSDVSELVLDTRKGELLTGFYIRAAQSVDGLGVITNMGKINGVFGNPSAGTGHTLIAPRGYKIAGISGLIGENIDGFSLIITR
ncbi:hypothetical protein LOZ49_004693 [Ophidiomyces ophidiicola]|nr:hypothetical protein LOZ49_004693 [Ophidiomyces ophidiicola]